MSVTDEAEPVTISVVARLAGVSTATVSRVLQGTASTSTDARSRVLEAVSTLGYEPKRRARSRRVPHRVYGLVLPDLTRFSAEILVGLLAAARPEQASSRQPGPPGPGGSPGPPAAAGYASQAVLPLVGERLGDPTTLARELAARVDGLVVVGGMVPDATVMRIARRLPVVLVCREGLPRCRSITLGELQTARQLTAHLFDHGRERLVFVGDPDSAPDIAVRYQGFRQAHVVGGVPVRRPPLKVPPVEGAGRRIAEELQHRRVRVDGLVCATDELALGALAGLAETDLLVPDDLAVVGWGDTEAARLVVPGLTTVAQPLRQLGILAAQMLAEMATADGADEAAPVELPTEIVRRASCGCPGPRQRPRPVRGESRRRRSA